MVALALALAKRPRLLLLDEPVASLDPLARREFLQTLMGSVADTGTSVLLSSHLLADVERVCDYVIVLNAAQVRLAGPVDDLVVAHRRLVGPRHDGSPVAGVAEIVRASHTDRQSTLLVRIDGPVTDPRWTEHDVTLEDVILAHLADGDTKASHEAWGCRHDLADLAEAPPRGVLRRGRARGPRGVHGRHRAGHAQRLRRLRAARLRDPLREIGAGPGLGETCHRAVPIFPSCGQAR
ncbi:AAA family ATPase [Micromonospora sp. NPDC047707]|uniref:AAA family ATPase n=1 Tax=Micromonospora sp. NPDC047707 TaxID=3154498 RepID=UPI003455054A